MQEGEKGILTWDGFHQTAEEMSHIHRQEVDGKQKDLGKHLEDPQL